MSTVALISIKNAAILNTNGGEIMDSIRTVSMEYGDTRISIYLIDLAEDHKTPLPDTRPVMHSHFYYELHYAARGQYLYRFSDREIFLRQGEMLLIPPNVIHGAIDKESDVYTPHVLSLSLTATEAAAINYSPRHTARLIKNTYGASLSEIRRSRKNK